MKSLLLIVLALAVSCASYAQKKPVQSVISRVTSKDVKPEIREPENYVMVKANKPVQKTTRSTSAIVPVPVGSSVNIYGALLRYQSCMDYDPATKLIMHTHRGDQTTPGFATGNDVVESYSTDGGATWYEDYGFNGGSGTAEKCRYPSGVIFNPAGNTDPNGAYTVVGGPINNGAWEVTYLGSRTVGNANVNQIWETGANGYLYRENLCVTQPGVAFVGTAGNTEEGTGNYTDLWLQAYKGVYDAGTNVFDWSYWSFDTKPYTAFIDGYYEGLGGNFNMCFDRDGSIGYMWTVGIDARATNGCSYYPIVFKTTDAGTTWTPIDYFDFGSLPDVYAHLYDLPAQPGRVAPMFYEVYYDSPNTNYYTFEMDGVVDAYDNLHLFAVTSSAVSIYPSSDSLGYYYPNEMQKIFEFEYNVNANQWMANFVDTLVTDCVGSEQSLFTSSTGNVGYDHRLQASVSEDGTKVFVAWTDTDIDLWGLQEPYQDLYPDIQIWGRDVTTNKNTGPMNMTADSDLLGTCYFMYVSPTSIDGDNTTYIPVTITDLNTNGNNADAPVFFNYLKGLEVTDAMFVNVGTQELPKAKSTVGVCYPNPFNGFTKVDVVLNGNENVSVKVASITGQVVYNHNYGTLTSGLNTLTIDGSNLTTGVYFCTVTVGDKQTTNKLVVK